MYQFSEEDHRLHEEVVGRLKKYILEAADKLKPKLAILYGSFVRGDWHRGSDLDLLVVSDSVPLDFKDRWDLLYTVIMGFPVEPHIYTTREFEEMLKHGRMTALDALTEGIILYADEDFKRGVDKMLEETMIRLGPKKIDLGWELKKP